jgi:molybdenum cofactor cytidylyltransferase
MPLSNNPSIGLIILAAGGSNRLGQPKQLLPIAHKSLLTHTIEEGLRSRCSHIFVILGANAEKIATHIASYPVQVIVNESWEKGMGNSLKAAMKAIDKFDAIITAVCDQPFLSHTVLDQLIETWENGESTAVGSSYKGTVGVPALFDATRFDELRNISDLGGAKELLFRQSISTVPFPAGAIDIDTKEDWDNYLTNSSS